MNAARHIRPPIRRFLLALLLLGACQGAQALCLVCTATVTITNILVPAYNPLSATAATGTGNIRLKFGGLASLALPYSVAISKGSGTDFLQRRLMNGSYWLTYNIYPTVALSAIWGDGTGGSSLLEQVVSLDLLGLAPAIDYPVYVQIPAGQRTVPPGVYTDSVVITVTYF